jgi:hypothetical protein
LAKPLRSDALSRFHEQIGLRKDDQLRVRMHVDKTRAHDMPRASMISPMGGPCGATSAILPSHISTSAAQRAAPVPSITVPCCMV